MDEYYSSFQWPYLSLMLYHFDSSRVILSYLAYCFTLSLLFEPAEPSRMTPAKFPLPHVIPRLLHNGDTLEVQPNQPDAGQPATVCVLRRNLYQPSLLKFPGPLIKLVTCLFALLTFNLLRECYSSFP